MVFEIRACRVVVSAVILGAALACSSGKNRAFRVVEFPAAACPWVGSDEALVLESFGEPEERETDGQGGAILRYRRIRSSVDVGSGHFDGPFAQRTKAEHGTSAVPLPTTEVTPEDLAEFRVDAAHKVYRCWVDPKYDRKRSK